jgi:three-Cys-motif partner protein
MDSLKELELERIGNWSKIKIEIIKKYAKAYTTILKNQEFKFKYIDAFSGAGEHISKETGEITHGSPLVALDVTYPFREYYFIDLNYSKLKHLEIIIKERYPKLEERVKLFNRDCNEVIPKIVEEHVSYNKFERALCIFDPYGLQLNWDVVEKAGKNKAVEIFLNFSIMDMNRNYLRKYIEKKESGEKNRMTKFWGNNSWEKIGWEDKQSLFGIEKIRQQKVWEKIVKEYKQKLIKVAQFDYVLEPLLMKNKNNAPLYYLFFSFS